MWIFFIFFYLSCDSHLEDCSHLSSRNTLKTKKNHQTTKSFTLNFYTLSLKEILQYLKPLQKETSFSPFAYAHLSSDFNSSDRYIGGIYSPSQNRIYLSPYGTRASKDHWHYIDCYTGKINNIDNPYPPEDFFHAYNRGSYSPSQNRIYFTPVHQTRKTKWHYIDCSNDQIVEYEHGRPLEEFVTIPSSYAYASSVFSPTENRIYFIPSGQVKKPLWHYIDCLTGNVISYEHEQGQIDLLYVGGVYSPSENRIYFIPSNNLHLSSKFHYIDCTTGTVKSYEHGREPLEFSDVEPYREGVFSPTENRIYFIPSGQVKKPLWHYIDCETESLQTYEHFFDENDFNTAISMPYFGGVYSPLDNRIYFVPHSQTQFPTWHYIDCFKGKVHSYPNPFDPSSLSSAAYIGGTYSPLENKIYFVPRQQVSRSHFHGIQIFGNPKISRQWPVF
jgi:hypothetical protein